MKNIVKTIFVALLLPVINHSAPVLPTSGFAAYELKPVNVNKNVTLAIPFFTTKLTTFTFSYTVSNAKSHIIYSSPVIEKKIFANSTYYVTYEAKSGVTSVGENMMFIKWRTTESITESQHLAYFYGYVPGQRINCNNEAEVEEFRNTEKTYRYSGYQDNNGQKVKTVFEGPLLSGRAYFEHDLYFDFRALTIDTNRNYLERLFAEATLYTEDLTIFPHLSVRGKETVIPLKLTTAGDEITMFPNFKLYVDEKTLEIYQYAYPGLIQVPRLFFSKTKTKQLNLTYFRLEVIGFGFLEVDLHFDFSLDIGGSFIGEDGIHRVVISRY